MYFLASDATPARKSNLVLCGNTPHAGVGLLGQSDASPSPNRCHLRMPCPLSRKGSIAALRSVGTCTGSPTCCALPRHVRETRGWATKLWQLEMRMPSATVDTVLGKNLYHRGKEGNLMLSCAFIRSAEHSLHQKCCCRTSSCTSNPSLSCLSIRHGSIPYSLSLRFFCFSHLPLSSRSKCTIPS